MAHRYVLDLWPGPDAIVLHIALLRKRTDLAPFTKMSLLQFDELESLQRRDYKLHR
jgi:hypothetical protein